MDRETIRISKKFAKNIKKNIPIKKILLFGSRARGDNFKTSDFDFIIISENFKNIKFNERISKTYDFWNENFELEALCYTPEEFNKKLLIQGIVKKANEEGIEF